MTQQLFLTAFDHGFYRGWVAAQGLPPARDGVRFNPREAREPRSFPRRPRLLFGAPGLGALALGGVMGVGAGMATVATKLAYDAYLSQLRRDGVADPQQEMRINALRAATGVLVALGMVLLAVGGILVALEVLWPAAFPWEKSG